MIVFERILDHSVEQVWEALTNNEKLKQWYFDFKGAFKAEEGHEFTWEAGPPDGKIWLHKGKILEVKAPEKLAHTWEYPGYEGQAVLTWLLEELPESRTHLKTTFAFITPFDANEEALSKKNFEEGWEHIIHTSLPEYLHQTAG